MTKMTMQMVIVFCFGLFFGGTLGALIMGLLTISKIEEIERKTRDE